jgi:hypothetical protein
MQNNLPAPIFRMAKPGGVVGHFDVKSVRHACVEEAVKGKRADARHPTANAARRDYLGPSLRKCPEPFPHPQHAVIHHSDIELKSVDSAGCQFTSGCHATQSPEGVSHDSHAQRLLPPPTAMLTVGLDGASLSSEQVVEEARLGPDHFSCRVRVAQA